MAKEFSQDMSGLEFERRGPVARLLGRLLLNPMANFTPAGFMKSVLKFSKSELAAANWKDPGGWRSMVISYNGRPFQIADKILVGAGTMSRALRNRRRLASAIIAALIDESPAQATHVLCLGAGPGQIISDALARAKKPATATLVDISSDAFEYGRSLAARMGLSQRMRFVLGDARDVRKMLDQPPDIVKMLGLCEYLTDEQISSIAKALAEVMQPGSSIVTNSLSKAHGTDRFFRRVFGLHMIYRSKAELQALFGACGFADFVSHAEPLGVYDVMVGRRN